MSIYEIKKIHYIAAAGNKDDFLKMVIALIVLLF